MLGRDKNANMMFRLLKQIQLDQFRFPSVTMECLTFYFIYYYVKEVGCVDLMGIN